MAMISAKEAQQHVYSMFIDGMLTLEVDSSHFVSSLIFSIIYFRNYQKQMILIQLEHFISFV